MQKPSPKFGKLIKFMGEKSWYISGIASFGRQMVLG